MHRLMKLVSASVLAAALLTSLLPAAQEPKNNNVRFGMPSGAKKDPGQREDYLIERPQYVLSYNDKTKTPNWVCWRLLKRDTKKADRGGFEPDPLLPKEFMPVTTDLYTKTGFDRGHMCPSHDRSDSEENNDPTFFMTNIVPQVPNNNRVTWERLESYCRELAKKGNELHIACGPHGVGGVGENGFASKIGKDKIKITVPAHTWKVIMVLSEEGAKPSKRTRTIAVVVPNTQTVHYDWTKYRVSVRDVEELTGFNFFPDVANEIADVIEAVVDDEPVKVAAPKKKKQKE